MTSRKNDRQWDAVIRPRNGWFDINLRELAHYRDLIFLLVKRNITVLYKQTVLGPAWILIQAALNSLVFTVVFGGIAALPTDGMPQFLFYMAGNIVWAYFSNALKQTATTFIANHQLFGKVYFPRLVMPLSVVLSKLFNFFVQFALFAVFLVYYAVQPNSPVHPNWQLIAFVPLVLIQVGMLGMGLGIIISSLTTRYRAHRLSGLHGDGKLPAARRPLHAQPGHADRGVFPRRLSGHGELQPRLHAPVGGDDAGILRRRRAAVFAH